MFLKLLLFQNTDKLTTVKFLLLLYISKEIMQRYFVDNIENQNAVNSRYLKIEIYSKLLISQSNFSGSRKFTLIYQ